MKTSNGYLDMANPVTGSNNLALSVIERMENGDVRQATCQIAQADLAEFITELLALRGIVDEVDLQRPAKEVEKIVQTTVQVAQPIDQIVSQVVSGVQAIIPVPTPVDELVSKIADAVKAEQGAPVQTPPVSSDPAPAQGVTPS